MSVEVLEKRLARIEAKLIGKARSPIVWGETLEEVQAKARALAGKMATVYMIIAPWIEKPADAGTSRGSEPDDQYEAGAEQRTTARRSRARAPEPTAEPVLDDDNPEPLAATSRQPEQPERKSLAGSFHPRRSRGAGGAKYEPYPKGMDVYLRR